MEAEPTQSNSMPGTCVWGKGKVALVTGAARRVGRVIAAALHKHGYNLVIHCSASKDEALAFAAQLNSVRGDSAHVISADLSTTSVVETSERLVREAVAKWGRLDLLVNNAGVYLATPLDQATDHHWNYLMNINLKAPYFLIQAAAPHLRKVEGNVVNLADILGERPSPPLSIYCTSKAAIIMVTKSLAAELGPQIRVNYINPGAAMWPEKADDAFKKDWLSKTLLGRPGTGQEVADAVVFLASPAANYITGSGITTCGGRSVTL
ncbi:3-oxoacyl-[acyl-carrier-protein] reductase FabG-like isoform X2 [Panulirus ornatus]|uniref:3-oxoacyl-[acyl-carrier-protein] reductase FabG-like isoform X2 n=1 Tax=Panulirus ornatus TaxID=150431 RepID=UPI003A873311